MIELLAAASVDKARLLVSLFDPPQLNSACEALVLGSLAGSSVARASRCHASKTLTTLRPGLGLDAASNADVDSDFSAGCGVAIPPDPRLWSIAIMYKS